MHPEGSEEVGEGSGARVLQEEGDAGILPVEDSQEQEHKTLKLSQGRRRRPGVGDPVATSEQEKISSYYKKQLLASQQCPWLEWAASRSSFLSVEIYEEKLPP